MCLRFGRLDADASGMENHERIFRESCFRCERPALTFDDRRRPLCGRHATIFIAAARREPTTDEVWEMTVHGRASPA